MFNLDAIANENKVKHNLKNGHIFHIIHIES